MGVVQCAVIVDSCVVRVMDEQAWQGMEMPYMCAEAGGGMST